MEHTQMESRIERGGTYAEPLSGLQVSWGALLAGTVTLFASSLILFGFCLAILLTATDTVSSGGGRIAAILAGIASLIVGGYLGGLAAGYLAGNPRRFVAGTHAFLAWCVAFLFSNLVSTSLIAQMMPTLRGESAVVTWIYFATWSAIGVATVLGGLSAVPRLRKVASERKEFAEREAREHGPGRGPLEPTPGHA